MAHYRYFALPKDAIVGSGEIRSDRIAEFFVVVRQVSGIERAAAEPLLHSGRRIETEGFLIWAVSINPFHPAKVI